MPTMVSRTRTAPTWDFPRNPFGAFVVAQVAGERGLAVSRALAATGLEPSDLTRQDLEIAAGQELTVIRNVLRWLGDEAGIGAEAGARMTLGMIGVWGFAMLNSRTTREAIDVALRYGYGHFSFVFARPFVEQHEHEVHIALDAAELPGELRPFLIERDLAAHVVLARQILGAQALVRTETTLDDARARPLAATLAPHRLIPGCGRDALVLPAGILDVGLPAADQYALERWTQQCEAMITRHPGHDGSAVVSTVRSAVLRDPQHAPALEEIARVLNVSPRTLRRRLADSNTSFRGILDDIRRLIAEDLLGEGNTVTDVAYRMGYADAASFSRAFKRWTGRTPGTPPLDDRASGSVG
jgi:AraC-like DNA-binding protein